MASNYNIDIDAGSNYSLVVTYRDNSGTAINLTGYSAKMQLKRGYADAVASFELSTVNSRITLGGIAGTITLAISAADTGTLSGKYLYDLEITSGSGYVTRLIEGAVTVSPEVTI